MRIVVALGGNALLKRGEPQTAAVQRQNARVAATAIAAIAPGSELIVTHGNGPQIGLLALQGAAGGATTYPLDVLNAETDGMIGYLLEQELANALGECRVATLLTQVEVDPADPAFGRPTKFIGPQYDADEAQRVAASQGWAMAQDGTRWRRVVPSPEPRDLLEIRAIRQLVASGFVTICAGGGGIPVARAKDGRYEGVECVVDKDLTSALLAERLEADCLMMLTDVPAVYVDFGMPSARQIRSARPQDLASFRFPAGSMGPKVEAARRFARQDGRRACIGRLDQVRDILEGRAGTTVSPHAPGIEMLTPDAGRGAAGPA
jgi:carbamate kinase